MKFIKVIAYALLIIGAIILFFVGLILPIFVAQSAGFIYWTMGICVGCIVLGSFLAVIYLATQGSAKKSIISQKA